jgi:hypothetical protein
MSIQTKTWTAGVLSLALLGSAAVGWSRSDHAGYAGAVIDVDKSAGRIVVGDMGPALGDGKGEVIRRNIQVTPSTEFVKVKRASGTAPSGFVGDYVETKLPAWDVKPGEWVAVKVRPEKQSSEALKITVVDTGEP